MPWRRSPRRRYERSESRRSQRHRRLVDQYPVLRAEAAHDGQRGVPRAIAHRERRTFLEAEVVWHRHDISGLSGSQLGLTPELGPGHHPLPDDKTADTGADGLDFAGDLEPRTHGLFGVAG